MRRNMVDEKDKPDEKEKRDEKKRGEKKGGETKETEKEIRDEKEKIKREMRDLESDDKREKPEKPSSNNKDHEPDEHESEETRVTWRSRVGKSSGRALHGGPEFFFNLISLFSTSQLFFNPGRLFFQPYGLSLLFNLVSTHGFFSTSHVFFPASLCVLIGGG